MSGQDASSRKIQAADLAAGGAGPVRGTARMIPEHTHAWGGPSMEDWCKPGCPFYDHVHDALDIIRPGRVPPRECIRAARDALTKAYAISDARQTWPLMLEALDWLRRGLEQIAAGLLG